MLIKGMPKWKFHLTTTVRQGAVRRKVILGNLGSAAAVILGNLASAVAVILGNLGSTAAVPQCRAHWAGQIKNGTYFDVDSVAIID